MVFNTESLDGALLIDKPKELTSAEVVRQLKKTHNIKKIGHAGTLDPMATGLLVVLLGKATKLQDVLLTKDKTYSGEIALGFETDSDDVTGEVTKGEREAGDVFSEESFEKIQNSLIKKFSGTFSQVPPKVSAVKIKGKPAYKLKREGKSFEIAAKEVTVNNLDLKYIDPNTLSYEVNSKSGFYVRALARDLGREIESLACLKSIRRETCSGYDLDDASSLEELLDADISLPIIKIDSLLDCLPKVELSFDECQKLKTGLQGSLSELELESNENLAAVYNETGEACALIERKERAAVSSIQGNANWKLRVVF